MILCFLSATNSFLQSNKSFFVEKVQKKFIEKIPKFIFFAFLSHNFSKNFKFSKFFVNREPSARGNPLLGPSAPKSGSTPHPRGKKFGRRHRKIAENRVFTVLMTIFPNHWTSCRVRMQSPLELYSFLFLSQNRTLSNY